MWLRLLPVGRSLYVSSPVSRILSHGPKPAWVAIYLRPPVTERLMRPTRRLQASNLQTPLYSALHRVGLARPPCHHDAGALLPHLFTFAAGEPACCVFSVALSLGFPSLDVIQHPALWCPDFPRSHASAAPRLPGLLPQYTPSRHRRRPGADASARCALEWETTSRSGMQLGARPALPSTQAPAPCRSGTWR